MIMNRFITTGEAARAIGISSATLTRWAAADLVTPAERTAGGHYRWHLASLRAQLRRRNLGERDVTAEDIARVVHAANRELQIIQGDPAPSPPWDEAPDYQVREATAGVKEVIRDPDLTAEQSHELWCDRMRADRWTYGTTKDFERKTHPTLLPFGELPTEQQLKDRLFIAIVRALAPQPSNALYPTWVSDLQSSFYDASSRRRRRPSRHHHRGVDRHNRQTITNRDDRMANRIQRATMTSDQADEQWAEQFAEKIIGVQVGCTVCGAVVQRRRLLRHVMIHGKRPPRQET